MEDPAMSAVGLIKRQLAAAVAASCVVAFGVANAADVPPEDVDLSRLAVQHTLRILDTGAQRIFINADVDSGVKRAGVLGPGVCLTIFMQLRDSSGGYVIDLESTLAIQGKVVSRTTCQGRKELRDFAVDISKRGNFSPYKAKDGSTYIPTLAPMAQRLRDGELIGTLQYYAFGSQNSLTLSSESEGLGLEGSVYDAKGQLVRVRVRYDYWGEEKPLSPDIYAAIGDLKQKTTREIRDISLDRDGQGRVTALWLQRSWARFDAAGETMKVPGSFDDVMLKGPRELLARIEWNGMDAGSIRNPKGDLVTFARSPDRRDLVVAQVAQRVGRVEFNGSGLITSISDDKGERTLFYSAGATWPLAYLSPAGCIHTFGRTGLSENFGYKTEMRVNCPSAEPVQWEGNFTYDSFSGNISGSTRVIDAKGSREVNNFAR